MATAVTTVKATIRTKGAISGIAGLGDELRSVEGEGDGLREGEDAAAK
jgi:hypothetical protein